MIDFTDDEARQSDRDEELDSVDDEYDEIGFDERDFLDERLRRLERLD